MNNRQGGDAQQSRRSRCHPESIIGREQLPNDFPKGLPFQILRQNRGHHKRQQHDLTQQDGDSERVQVLQSPAQ